VQTVISALPLLALLMSATPDGGVSEFDRLQAIAGDWKATSTAGKSLNIIYHLMSAGTVLVETYGAGSGRETMTVYHPDGSTLIATHYCAQGNQPRLHLQSAAAAHWVFMFADATNLPDPNASHLVRLELQLIDPNHLVRTETYRENGKEDVAKLELVRTR
jgi:hypothetical protein